VSVLFDELESFNAEQYVRDTIDMSRRVAEPTAYSGRKLQRHWSRVIGIEELYDLPEGDYIDKRSGIPNDEELAEIRRLRDDYYRRFRRNDDDGK